MTHYRHYSSTRQLTFLVVCLLFLLPEFFFFFFNHPPPPDIYTSLHDALPISCLFAFSCWACHNNRPPNTPLPPKRSEEHTSELQSRGHLVCRLLLEKKKIQRLKALPIMITSDNYLYHASFYPPPLAIPRHDSL